jgi:hypothetical protein
MHRLTVLTLLAMYATQATAHDGLGGMLPISPPPSASDPDPIGTAFKGLVAEVEDDLGDRDQPIDRIETEGCTSRLIGKTHRWTIDWRVMETVTPADTFLFIRGKDTALAIVGEAIKPDQAQKLSQLVSAMRVVLARCASAPEPKL